MAQTTTKTSTRTKALAAVGVLAAIGIVGFAAAMMYMKAASPDLVVTMSEMTDPVAFAPEGSNPPNTQASYIVKVTNKGNKKTGSFKFTVVSDIVYMDAQMMDASKFSDYSNIPYGKSFTVINLAPGESVDVKAYYNNSDHNFVPCDGSTTNMAVTATVDTESTVAELNETNNTATQTTTLNGTSTCPDLSMTITEDTNSVSPNDDVEYMITVTNDGLEDTSEFTYLLENNMGDFDSFSNLGGASDAVCENKPVTKPVPHVVLACTLQLAGSGDSDTVRVSIGNGGSKTPPCGKTTEVLVTAEADSIDEENEIDETNNTTTETTTFEGPAC